MQNTQAAHARTFAVLHSVTGRNDWGYPYASLTIDRGKGAHEGAASFAREPPSDASTYYAACTSCSSATTCLARSNMKLAFPGIATVRPTIPWKRVP